MFEVVTQEANRDVASRWLTFAGLLLGVNGAASVAMFVERIRSLIPAELINERYVYFALLFSIIAAVPLRIFPIVLSVSIAQMGTATSGLYLAFALTPHFLPEYRFEITLVLIAIVVGLQIALIGGYRYLIAMRAWSDFALSIALSICFAAVWVLPFVEIWS
jgi:hypothetical protein